MVYAIGALEKKDVPAERTQREWREHLLKGMQLEGSRGKKGQKMGENKRGYIRRRIKRPVVLKKKKENKGRIEIRRQTADERNTQRQKEDDQKTGGKGGL